MPLSFCIDLFNNKFLKVKSLQIFIKPFKVENSGFPISL